MVCFAKMAPGFCLQDRTQLVDICAHWNNCVWNYINNGKLAELASSYEEPGRCLAIRVGTRKIKNNKTNKREQLHLKNPDQKPEK